MPPRLGIMNYEATAPLKKMNPFFWGSLFLRLNALLRVRLGGRIEEIARVCFMNKLVRFGAGFLGAALIANCAQQRNYGDIVRIISIEQDYLSHSGVTLVTSDGDKLSQDSVVCIDEIQQARLIEFLSDNLKGVTPVNPAIVCNWAPPP